MLTEKRESLIEDKLKYETGLAKLNSTEEIVKVLEAELAIKNVEVKEKKDSAAKVAEVVGKEKAIVEAENNKALIKEKECKEIAVNVQAQKESCESDVEKLKPLVKSALSKVKNLDPNSISEIRKYSKPPRGVDKVFFCIMHIFAGVKGGYDDNIELKGKKNPVPKNLTWKGALKLISDPGKIIKDLMRFPKEIENANVPANNFKLIEPYFKEKIMNDPEAMKKVS